MRLSFASSRISRRLSAIKGAHKADLRVSRKMEQAKKNTAAPKRRIVQNVQKIDISLLLFVWFSGCTLLQGGITYYDSTTYKNLTDLKPEVVMLYESFASENLDSLWIRSIRLRFAQMYEYEKGKGSTNEPTYRQIGETKTMFERQVKDRLDRGPWSGTHTKNTIENISEAFDIAIETERLKNKNE